MSAAFLSNIKDSNHGPNFVAAGLFSAKALASRSIAEKFQLCSQRRQATGPFERARQACDVMNGRPLMLWGIKDNFLNDPLLNVWVAPLSPEHNKFSAATVLITFF